MVSSANGKTSGAVKASAAVEDDRPVLFDGEYGYGHYRGEGPAPFKIEVFGEQAKALMERVGLAGDEDQSPFKGMARLRYVEGRAVVELEVA